jgi:hypothetical protein
VIPLIYQILKPMRLATGGTVLACRLALEHGVAINLGGGYHHAERERTKRKKRKDMQSDAKEKGHAKRRQPSPAGRAMCRALSPL